MYHININKSNLKCQKIELLITDQRQVEKKE